MDVHRILLNEGITIIEGLRLQEVVPGLYEFIAMPMKIHGADGAPARVVVRRITDSEEDIAPL